MPVQDDEQSPVDDQPLADEADDSDGEPPPLCEDDSNSSDEDEAPQQISLPAADTPVVTEAQDKEPAVRLKRQLCQKTESASRSYLCEGDRKVKWCTPYESGDLTNSESDSPPGLAEDSSDEDNYCINTDIPVDAQPKARDSWKPNRKSAPHLCYYPNGERKPDSEIAVGSDDDSDNSAPVKGPKSGATVQKGISHPSPTRESSTSNIGGETSGILDRRIAYDPDDTG